MQVKKFEAPTIQEALETIKRELGPEAIILQTKQNKKGFGLLSKSSVEVTAAVSDRALNKKQAVDSRLPEQSRLAMQKLSASRQAKLLDRYAGRYVKESGVSMGAEGQADGMIVATEVRERVSLSSKPQAQAQKQTRAQEKRTAVPTVQAPAAKAARITATRYAEIDAEEMAEPRELVTPGRAQGAVQRNAQAISERRELESEIRDLKNRIMSMQEQQERESRRESQMAPALADLPQGMQGPAVVETYEKMLLAGVEKKNAYALVKKSMHELHADGVRNPDADTVLERVALELMTSTEVLPAYAGIGPRAERAQPVVIALVGPTGVGKTTTIAKMASEVIHKRGWKVGLINLDQYKVAAFDQLATYAKLLNVPFRSAATADDLKAAIKELASVDTILIDTTGRSQKDPQALQELKNLLSQVSDLRVHLVLSATTRDTELYDMAGRFSVFRPQGITISKLDEATLYGAIHNVSQKAKLPLLYFTTGQRVPEDIEEATQERVASLILDI